MWCRSLLFSGLISERPSRRPPGLLFRQAAELAYPKVFVGRTGKGLMGIFQKDGIDREKMGSARIRWTGRRSGGVNPESENGMIPLSILKEAGKSRCAASLDWIAKMENRIRKYFDESGAGNTEPNRGMHDPAHPADQEYKAIAQIIPIEPGWYAEFDLSRELPERQGWGYRRVVCLALLRYESREGVWERIEPCCMLEGEVEPIGDVGGLHRDAALGRSGGNRLFRGDRAGTGMNRSTR